MPFFFQAYAGIRGTSVTGVQTCALPIYPSMAGVLCDDLTVETLRQLAPPVSMTLLWPVFSATPNDAERSITRSEERRVGKDGRCRLLPGSEQMNDERDRRMQ